MNANATEAKEEASNAVAANIPNDAANIPDQGNPDANAPVAAVATTSNVQRATSSNASYYEERTRKEALKTLFSADAAVDTPQSSSARPQRQSPSSLGQPNTNDHEHHAARIQVARDSSRAMEDSVKRAAVSNRFSNKRPGVTNVSNGVDNSGELDSRIATKIVQERMLHMDAVTSSNRALVASQKKGGDGDRKKHQQGMVAPMAPGGSLQQATTQQQPQSTSQTSDPGAVFVAGLDATSATFRDDELDFSTDVEAMQTPPASTPNLIEATLVESQAFVQAEPMDESHHVELKDVVRNKTLCLKLLMGMCVMTAVAVIVAVSVVMSRNDDKEEDQDGPKEREPPQLFSLELQALTIQEIHNDSSSPQALANHWMLDDPNLLNYTTERKFRRFGLAVMYYATHGDHWFHNSHWLDHHTHECEWYSSHPQPICDPQQFSMQHLNLSGNNLHGTTPPEMRYISVRKFVDLSHNRLQGLPPPLNYGANMEGMICSDNNFGGELTTNLAKAWSTPSLRILRIDRNRFYGTLPSLFSMALPGLEEFDASYNQFTGSLPVDSSAIDSRLRLLNFTGNDMSGTIPTSVGLLPNLQQLALAGNSGITGTLPSQFGILRNLTLLDLVGTSLTGSIPQEVCLSVTYGQLKILADCDKITCCPT